MIKKIEIVFFSIVISIIFMQNSTAMNLRNNIFRRTSSLHNSFPSISSFDLYKSGTFLAFKGMRLNTNFVHSKKSRFLSSVNNNEDHYNNKKNGLLLVLGTAIGGSYLANKYNSTRCEESPQNNNSIPIKSDRVRIMHRIGQGGILESVRKHGLLSRNELFKRGLTEVDPSEFSGMMVGHYDHIYFSYDFGNCDTSNCVSLEVDPDSTYVYNMEYRFFRCKQGYFNSRILLSTYIANKEKAEIMMQNAPEGKTVRFNPQTAEPFYIDHNDRRANLKLSDLYYDFATQKAVEVGNSVYLYMPEIIFHRNNIPPEELIFFEDNKKN